MVKPQMEANAISAPSASKRSTSDLTRCTTIGKLLQNKSDKFYRLIVKAAVSEALAALLGLAYNTVVSLVRAASQQAQLVHNGEVQAVQTEQVSADELWSFVEKNKSNVCQLN